MASAGQAVQPATPTVEQAATQPKSIVLFSDGTGNSSGKLFKTNVWRMYEAVDLGLPQGTQRVQIAYYDNGIGTSKVKAWALLTGIFGIGLKRNMLAIYRFVCRNYRPGDSIYCFGFSRGAFTIRLVAGMIAKKGVVIYDTDTELEARTLDVLREYSAANNPNILPTARINRAIRDGLVKLKRLIFGPKLPPKRMTAPVPITFLGVWDTVAAYGGPSAEVTRAVDNFIHPLTMTDHKLNSLVQVARHALAIDDERDSFHPVLWDEVAWNDEATKAHPGDDPDSLLARAAYNERLQQVWFAGMHSDVGGGYPDESLSYVSLQWMMTEARDAGLRLLPDLVNRVRLISNSLGPIHNSRSGLASYYRYQPRKIAAYLHPSSGMNYEGETLSLRDPFEKERRGHLLTCHLHESAASRIAFGTDGYAPVILPRQVVVVPYSVGVAGGGGNPNISLNFRNDLAAGDKAFSARQEALYDLVWRHRLTYFLTVLATLLLVSMPLYAKYLALPRTVDNRWIFERLTGWTHYTLPNIVQPWVQAFEASPLWFWLMVFAIALGSYFSRRLHAGVRTGMRELWALRLSRQPVPQEAAPSALQRIRNSWGYQRGLQLFKWVALPTLVGLIMLAGIIYAATIVVAQISLSIGEKTLCVRSPGKLAIQPSLDGYDFKTISTCNGTGLRVEKNHRYAIEFIVPKDGQGRPSWKDNGIPASPEGLPPFELGIKGYLAAPLLRVANARYLQPLYQVRPANNLHGRRGSVIVKSIEMAPVGEVGECLIYRGDIQPTADGELFLYVNDAVMIGQRERYYNNNEGSARVFIHDWHALPDAETATAYQSGEEGKRGPKVDRCQLAKTAAER
ncbi:MAG: DUF2235 domain-containing protein [Sphingomicrobium sp.]